ncbi:hypothetical protein WJX73_010182 [Symbiochloris irregularis]|uniref:Uncharacterized protein n=1 Tax=Symbiochloris irregularis TaxID=706552 RepID=A0AAW1P118_9CHLO
MHNIAVELRARGHELKYLFPSDMQDLADTLRLPQNAQLKFEPIQKASQLLDAGNELRRLGKQHEMFKLLALHTNMSKGAIADDSAVAAVQAFKPDLILYDVAFPTGLPVATKLGIATVGFWVVAPLGNFVTYFAGSPASPAVMPQFPGWYPQPLGYLDRLRNAGSWAFGLMIIRAFENVYDPMWHNYGMKHTGYLREAQKSAAVIYQTDWAFAPAMAMSPHTHVVGALTAKPAQPLTGDLKAFCEAAAAEGKGVVFISFGTSSTPDDLILRGVSQAVAKVPQLRFIWKVTATEQQSMKQAGIPIPGNAQVVEYAPQQDLLGHPAIIGFVTQGGTNSILEGLYHGVPMIVVPLLGEQPFNSRQVSLQACVCVYSIVLVRMPGSA